MAYDRDFPKRAAADMRARADAALGAERDYFNWLAIEWERASERVASQRPPMTPRDGSRTPRP